MSIQDIYNEAYDEFNNNIPNNIPIGVWIKSVALIAASRDHQMLSQAIIQRARAFEKYLKEDMQSTVISDDEYT